ncbi:MAG TPA: haloacid dehalogenase [Armatimonadota bacterium]|nr:haloacid dehalogenase [Armatimonadota bacterium]
MTAERPSPGQSLEPGPAARVDRPSGAARAAELNRVTEIDGIAEQARACLEEANRAREAALALSRELIRCSANSIRAIHRGEMDQASTLLDRAAGLASQLTNIARGDIFYAGYSQDSLKEFAEARSVYALVNNEPLPNAATLGIPWPAYLNGLGEAVGEMRRHCLDLLRGGKTSRAEFILDIMDIVYSVLVTIDYPDAVTSGLRRTTDMVRGILERTRADLTTAVLQQRLDARMEELSRRLT